MKLNERMNMRSLFPAALLAVVLSASCSRNKIDADAFCIPFSPAEPQTEDLLDAVVWEAIPPVEVFHAPWDDMDDSTSFRCFATDSLFFFRFDVMENTLTLEEGFKDERDVEYEDRVEIFFSPAGELKTYVGAEIDPMGRVMDYKCTYYRDFDYGWNFETMECFRRMTPSGYSIAGHVSWSELEDLGIDNRKGFLMGAFRADFRPDKSVNWYSLKLTSDEEADFHQRNVFFEAKVVKEEHGSMRGAVLSVEDLASYDWPALAFKSGINTIGTHIRPSQVLEFMKSGEGKAFLDGCSKYGLDVEHQLHAMGELLPRELFSEDSTMFRMDEDGRRTPDRNCCAHSEKALEIIASKAAWYARELPATNHRYYFWLDDNSPVCSCPLCKEYTASEQALMIENRMIEAIREVDPQAKLAHLAYEGTMEPPRKVEPADGIFLEFAPIDRQWDRPLADLSAPGSRKHPMRHEEVLRLLDANLEVFPAEDAVVLEYWLDVSLASGWKKPAVNLPWHGDVFVSDIATYASRGIRSFTSFAVYMDSTYFREYPFQPALADYGSVLYICNLNRND